MRKAGWLQDTLGLAGWLVLTFAAAAAGAQGSMSAQSLYDQLVQPAWAPPPWVFGPVWSILYAMMAIAAWLVWRSAELRVVRVPLALFVVQLLLNALWSWLFFAWSLGGWAFADILLLWVLIISTLIAFWRIRPVAGLMLVPYLLWVGFAAVLNLVLWQLNPDVLG